MAVDYDFTTKTMMSLFVVSMMLIYLYFRRNYNYWKCRGIPQTDTLPLFGSIHMFFGKPMHQVEIERVRKYGRLFGSYEGMKPYLYVADPQLLKNIMVKDFHIFPNRRRFDFGDPVINKILLIARDQEWKRIRTIVSPTFTSGKMRKMAVLINECAENMVKHGNKLAEKGEAIDCKPFYGAFTLDVICSVAFGTKLNSLEDPDNPFVKNAKAFGSQNRLILLLSLAAPRLCRLLKLEVFPLEVIRYYQTAVQEIMRRRKEMNERGNDFLQLMVDAQQDALEPSSEFKDTQASAQQEMHSPRDKTLTMDELLAQAVLFLLSGYEMTANPIAFVTYNLALNPDCQDKLIKETDQVWERHGGVDFDVVTKMPYLHAVICESQRIISVSVRTERVCEEDYKLGDTGIMISKGMIVGIPIHAMHHDPEWFPDPEKFQPERFFPQNRSSIPRFAYLPFGEGPRNCIAERFVMMEMKICLVYMLRHFRFVATDETKRPLEFYNGRPFLQPKNVIVKLEPRIPK